MLPESSSPSSYISSKWFMMFCTNFSFPRISNKNIFISCTDKPAVWHIGPDRSQTLVCLYFLLFCWHFFIIQLWHAWKLWLPILLEQRDIDYIRWFDALIFEVSHFPENMRYAVIQALTKTLLLSIINLSLLILPDHRARMHAHTHGRTSRAVDEHVSKEANYLCICMSEHVL